jgi:hypothetical protein
MPPGAPVIAPEMAAAPNASLFGEVAAVSQTGLAAALRARLNQPGPRRTPHSLAVADRPRHDTQEWLPGQVPLCDGVRPPRFPRLTH